MTDTQNAISIFIVLLLVASAVAMVTKWIRVPYTLALVMVGLVISQMHFIPGVEVSPELILLIFLPALLFEASWNLKLEHLKENFIPICLLAGVGVCLSTGVVGALLHWAAGLSWTSGLLFGSMISATDPVSVLALFRHFGLPKRLSTIVEGESLFNDGTAVVVFRIMLGIAAGAVSGGFAGMVGSGLRQFGLVVVGGAAVGALVGLAATTVTSFFDDRLLEITLTTIAAYGSFLLAEGMHVSPVIAVLVAGLVLGNRGRSVGMSATTQIAINAFWEYAAFVVNSLVFLLIGLEVRTSILINNAGMIGWAVVAVLAGRVAAVYGLVPVSNLAGPQIPARWQHVLVLGGLRGSLSIALALSLPNSIPGRSQLIAMVFGVVIFSLLVQGLSMSTVLKALGLTQVSPAVREFELNLGRVLSDSAVVNELDRLKEHGLLTEETYESCRDAITKEYEEAQQRLAELRTAEPAIQERQEGRIKRHLVDARRVRLTELLRDGSISEDSYRMLNQELDRSTLDLNGHGS